MKTIGIIPARFGSTRFPGKPLALLSGRPMIAWTYLNSCQAKKIDLVIVATDDIRIAKVIENLGGKVIMTDSQCQNGTVRCAQALNYLEQETDNCWDLIINIQGDEPYVKPSHLDFLVTLAENNKQSNMFALATPIQNEQEWRNPNITKVVMNKQNEALYFSRAPIPFSKSGQFKPDNLYYRNCGLYGFRRQFLINYLSEEIGPLQTEEDLEQLKTLEMGHAIQMGVLDKDDQVWPGVDCPEDLEKLEKSKFNEA